MRVTHLNGLRALEVTLRTGSFRSAANELGVTPAAVGQQVRTLESYLGCELFKRTTTGVQATVQAQQIEQRLIACFSSLEGIVKRLKNARSENRLAITMPSSFAENWFTGRLSSFYRLNSKIDLRLDASNRMVNLQAEDYDFAIRYSESVKDTDIKHCLFGDFVLPVCTPKFARQHRLPGRRKSLVGIPLVHLDDRTPDPEWADWRKWANHFGYEDHALLKGIRLTEFHSGVQVAIKGQGLVLCGIVEVYQSLKDGELVAPFGLDRVYPTKYKYRLVEVGKQIHSELHEQFRSWISNQAREFRAELNDFLPRTT